MISTILKVRLRIQYTNPLNDHKVDIMLINYITNKIRKIKKYNERNFN